MRHQFRDRVGRDQGVGVDTDKQLFRHLLQSEVQRVRFAGVWLGQHHDPAGRDLILEGGARDLQSRVRGTIVDDNHAKVLVIGIQDRTDGALDDLCLIVGGDEHGHRWLVAGIEVALAPMEAVEDGQSPDQHQAPAHQHVAHEENENDERGDDSEHAEGKSVDPGGPAFIGRNGRHDFSACLAQQIGNRNDLVTPGPQAVDHHAQRLDGLAAVTTAIVQQDDVSTAEIGGLTGRQVGQHVGHNVICGAPRIIVPVVGVDLVSHRDKAHVLRELQGADLVGGIRLLVNRIGRTEEHGLDSQLAFEQPLGEIQFLLEVALGNVADIGMGEGVVPDFVAFLVNALGNAGILFNFQPDEEEGGLDVFFFQYVENLGSPGRVGAVVEGDGNLLLRGPAVHVNFVRRRHGLKNFVADQVGVGIHLDRALARGRT